jgi:hypothetical protein
MARRLPVENLRGYSLAAFGLWMLVGGALTVALTLGGSRWTVGPLVPLPAFAALLGALLLLEAYANRKRPRPTGPAETPPPPVRTDAAPGPTAPGGRAWRMPVWLHPLLQVPLMAGSLFGGGIVGFFTYGLLMVGATRATRAAGAEPGPAATAVAYAFPLAVGIPCSFVGAVVALAQARRLFFQYVPARCPRCGGAAYGKPGKPITYYCRACGHAHATIWYEKGGLPPDGPDRPPVTAPERRPGAARRRGRRRRG